MFSRWSHSIALLTFKPDALLKPTKHDIFDANKHEKKNFMKYLLTRGSSSLFGVCHTIMNETFSIKKKRSIKMKISCSFRYRRAMIAHVSINNSKVCVNNALFFVRKRR